MKDKKRRVPLPNSLEVKKKSTERDEYVSRSKPFVLFILETNNTKMPPKKGKQKEQKPKKDASKLAADKTFGLKNKNKSAKVQRFVKEVEDNAKNSMAMQKKEFAAQKRRLEEKKAEEAAKAEARALFGQLEQKVPFGVDPKTILCINFREGRCIKGAKCKFSHDLDIHKKATKKDLYTDDRAKKEADTMDTWDEAKLRDVIKSKHGNPQTTTDKVCKHFIEAVENSKYGWFWVCPNGGSECKYRHSLPEGFVLKTKEQKRLEKLAADELPKITLEEFIETEREKLPKTGLTPITLETFNRWKEQNKVRRLNAQKEEKGKKLTGKELIERKFLDKNYVEENDETVQYFDFSQFKKDLDPADAKIKDYGDGEHVVFEHKERSNAEAKEAVIPTSSLASETVTDTTPSTPETTPEVSDHETTEPATIKASSA